MLIMQGYLSSVPERTVRVRLKGQKGYLTVKGIGSESGASRFEWEKEIEVEDALKLLGLCEPGKIEKRRYLVVYEGNTWEVDEFFGENEGLILAEIELEKEEEEFAKPDWVGEDVTGDRRYYNSYLSRYPYKKWN